MIGIGKWEITINNMFIKATGVAEIIDNNGKYEIKVSLPDKYKNVRISYREISEVGSDTLAGKAEISLFPGKIFDGAFTFEVDRCHGYVTIPMFGGKRLDIKNGRKIG